MTAPSRELVYLCLGVLLFACAPQPTSTPALPTIKPVVTLASAVQTEQTVQLGTPAPTSSSPTSRPTGPASPLPTARAHLYDNVEEAQILAAVFPNLALTQDPSGYLVQGSKDWLVWVNDRDEGRITQAGREELIAVIGSQVGQNPPKEEAPYGPSTILLVVLEERDGKLAVTQRATPLGAMSPDGVDVRIERILDVDHDGQDEILLTTNSVQSQVTRTEAHLYRWVDNAFVELWMGLEENDNTAAVNQTDYFVYEGNVSSADLYHSGVDAIVVDATITAYSKDSQGRADLSAPANISTERTVYKWSGQSYAVDKALSTPASPQLSPTP